jgi:uncharacterized membrane protein YfcA
MGILTLEVIIGLSVAGVIAGFINTIAGGGSLLTLPALLLAGLPPDVANGTNRVGVLFQASSATFAFRGSGHLKNLPLAWIIAPTLVGAGGGAFVASRTPNDILEPILLGSMVVMAIMLAAKKSILIPATNEQAIQPKENKGALFGLLLAGFYGGFVQAGLGFLLLAVFGGMLRLDLVRANSVKAVTVLCLTLLALGIFLASGHVQWAPGLVLAVAGIIGARLGASFAMKIPPSTLRIVVLVTVTSASVWLLLRGS